MVYIYLTIPLKLFTSILAYFNFDRTITSVIGLSIIILCLWIVDKSTSWFIIQLIIVLSVHLCIPLGIVNTLPEVGPICNMLGRYDNVAFVSKLYVDNHLLAIFPSEIRKCIMEEAGYRLRRYRSFVPPFRVVPIWATQESLIDVYYTSFPGDRDVPFP